MGHILSTQGKTNEALAAFRRAVTRLYLKYRGAKDAQGKPFWETLILKDFAEMRAAGLNDPLMDEIENMFQQSGGAAPEAAQAGP